MPITAHRPEQRLVDLVGALGGTWHGNIAMCRCPAHAEWNHALTRMMIVRGANDPIAPCAVSQCLCVPDPSDRVGVKGELPAKRAMLLFV